MNYWKQFAEMLGLELGQEFVLTDSYGKRKDGYTYQITKNGILYKSQINDDWYGERSETIERLLEGYDKAVPKPWKPKKGEKYWYYSKCWKQEIFRTWEEDLFELCLWKIGNCFRTEEEAKAKGKEIMEQIQKEFEEE
mgnify:FL=1